MGQYDGQHMRYGRGDQMGQNGRSDHHDPREIMISMDGMIRWNDTGSRTSLIRHKKPRFGRDGKQEGHLGPCP